MSAVIETAELTRRFGSFTAVDRLTLRVEQGEIFGLLGPNGAGKTTAIKMLTGLLRPTSGTARVAGHEVTMEPDAVKRGLGYMSQLFSLYPDLTVEENVSLFAGLYGVTGDRLVARRKWALDMAGLESHRSRLTSTLPLGWKQRLALGCAVLHEPPLLFLDEPTSGVDPLSRRRFWDLIYSLAERGTTVLVSTHYMEEAERCQRIGLMNRGRLIALDRPAALRAAESDPLFEIQASDPLKAVSALRADPDTVDAVLFGREVHATVRDAVRGRDRIAALLSQAGVTPQRIEQALPTLEDAVVSLIRKAGGAADD
jgi:drug efflux transport system ATP-binding protein